MNLSYIKYSLFWLLMSFWRCCWGQEDNIQQIRQTPLIKIKTSKTSIASRASKATQLEQLKQNSRIKDRYEGQKLQDKPNGNGKMIYANGNYYEGQWVMGIKQGRGVQIYNDTGTKYQGQWKNNEPHGLGKQTYSQGSYYQGEYFQGFKHGKGQYYDFESKKTYIEIYDKGLLKQRKQEIHIAARAQDFPTIVMDKQRFNSEDLVKFCEQNPQIKQLHLQFLLKYYELKKVIHLQFIDKEVFLWSYKEVILFLIALGLKRYQQIFIKNKIKGKDFITLTEKEMKEDLNIKLGDRKRLINFINYLKASKGKYKNNKYSKLKSTKNLKYRNLNSLNLDQSLIIKQESDEQWRDMDSPTSKQKIKGSIKNLRQQNFATQNLDQYNSICENQIHSMQLDQRLEEQNDRIWQKQQNNYDQNKKITQSNKKINEQAIDSQNNRTLRQKQLARKQSSSEQTQSDDQDAMSIKKTKSGRGMEMMQLLIFLKGHKIQDFNIKEKDIEIMEQIGEGGYGKVYLGKLYSSQVAIKDYLKAGRCHKSLDDFMKQVDVLSDLKHPNIVLYMGVCITATRYRLVTEYLENGSLFDQIHKKGKRFTNKQQFQIVSDIVKGMVYLHNMKNVLHRDLKSSNVLIAQDWKVKLCDFGLSVNRKKKSKKNNRIGTIQWMAPEVIRNEEIDFASDVYSFGVILWEIISQKIPYEGLAEAQIVGLVGYDQNHKLPKVDGDDFLVRIMEKCLNKVPSERPTFKQIQDEINKIEECMINLQDSN